MREYTVERHKNEYVITPKAQGGYTVFPSFSPREYDGEGLWFEGVSSFECRGERVYFHILPDVGGYYVAADPLVPIDGMCNMRDLGGYSTQDGCFVAYNHFYRGDRPADASLRGRAQLRRLGLKTIFDFRSLTDAKRNPDPHFKGARSEVIPAAFADSKMDFHMQQIKEYTDEQLIAFTDIFVDQYAKMPFDNAAFKAFFAAVKAGETPVYFHCTAGKDRTGLAAALLLTALGVPYDTVERDYLLSNHYRAQWLEKVKNYPIKLSDTARAAVLSMLVVNERYIRTAFGEIKARYKSFDEYLEKEGLANPQEVKKLREQYLIKAEVTKK